MLPDQIGIAKTEGGMVLAQLNQILVVLEHLRIALQVIPVEMIDTVRRLKTVVHTFFVAQQFLATKHEGHTL